jgi:hypothetical protein
MSAVSWSPNCRQASAMRSRTRAAS